MNKILPVCSGLVFSLAFSRFFFNLKVWKGSDKGLAYNVVDWCLSLIFGMGFEMVNDQTFLKCAEKVLLLYFEAINMDQTA